METNLPRRDADAGGGVRDLITDAGMQKAGTRKQLADDRARVSEPRNPVFSGNMVVEDYRRTIATEKDTVILENPSRVMLSVQVIGTESSILLRLGHLTNGGKGGRVLDRAPATDRGGGYWQCDVYTGSVYLRALSAAVKVNIVEMCR